MKHRIAILDQGGMDLKGHCEGDGDKFYIQLGGNTTTTDELIEQVRDLYR